MATLYPVLSDCHMSAVVIGRANDPEIALGMWCQYHGKSRLSPAKPVFVFRVGSHYLPDHFMETRNNAEVYKAELVDGFYIPAM